MWSNFISSLFFLSACFFLLFFLEFLLWTSPCLFLFPSTLSHPIVVVCKSRPTLLFFDSTDLSRIQTLLTFVATNSCGPSGSGLFSWTLPLLEMPSSSVCYLPRFPFFFHLYHFLFPFFLILSSDFFIFLFVREKRTIHCPRNKLKLLSFKLPFMIPSFANLIRRHQRVCGCVVETHSLHDQRFLRGCVRSLWWGVRAVVV